MTAFLAEDTISSSSVIAALTYDDSYETFPLFPTQGLPEFMSHPGSSQWWMFPAFLPEKSAAGCHVSTPEMALGRKQLLLPHNSNCSAPLPLTADHLLHASTLEVSCSVNPLPTDKPSAYHEDINSGQQRPIPEIIFPCYSASHRMTKYLCLPALAWLLILIGAILLAPVCTRIRCNRKENYVLS